MHGGCRKCPHEQCQDTFRSCPYAGINRIRFNGSTLVGVSGENATPRNRGHYNVRKRQQRVLRIGGIDWNDATRNRPAAVLTPASAPVC